jgi:hypothetical protein
MALFNLTDIKFKRETRGPLNSIVESQYATDILKYPIDIGTNYDKGHYMVLYINQQENTAAEFQRPQSTTDQPSALQQSRAIGNLRGASNLSQSSGVVVEQLSNFLGSLGIDASTGQRIAQKGQGNLLRTVKRTTDAIALYMPDTLNFTYNQSYSDVSSFNALGTLGTLAAGGASIFDNRNGRGAAPDQLTNISAFALQLARDTQLLNDGITTLGLAAFGVASNPGLELLYTSPSFRSFRFDFMFYPRSRREASEVIKIIRKLKFHQAPEIATRTGGRFLVPPSEFDIKFYYDGKENPNIPKVSTCVLETIDVDYAPNGFSAYEVPGELGATEGGTGMPTGIRLSLQFKETQIVTKEFLAVTDQVNESDYRRNFGDVRQSSDRIDDR